MHRPLGQAGGARGVHDEEEVVVAGAADDRRRGRGADHVLVAFGEVGAIGGVADVDPTGDLGAIGAARLELGHHLVERGAEHERGGAGVGEDERQFVGDEAPVECDDHAADLCGAEEGLDELRTVHQQGGDPVARGEAAGDKAVADLVASGVEFDVGLASTTGDVDDGFAVGVQEGALGHPLADVVFHAGMLDRGAWMMSCTWRSRVRWPPSG